MDVEFWKILFLCIEMSMWFLSFLLLTWYITLNDLQIFKKKAKKQVRGPDLGLRPPVHRPQTQTSSGSACLRAGTQPSPPGSGQRSAALCSPLWAMRHWNIAFYFFITIKKVYLLLLKSSCYTILYKLQVPNTVRSSQWFTLFKGHAPFIVIIKYWQYSLELMLHLTVCTARSPNHCIAPPRFRLPAGNH